MSKQKIKNIIEIIFLVILVVYFIKTLWINFASYEKVRKTPSLNSKEELVFPDNKYLIPN